MLHRKQRPGKLTDEVVRIARDGKRRGESRERLAKRLGVSTGTISRAWKTPEPARLDAPPVARPAPKPPVQRQVDADVAADVRAALLANLDDAESCEELAAAELALARHDHPRFAALLDAGDTRVIAMLAAGQAVAILSTPQDLADLARLVSEDPRPVVRDEGQSLAAHRREWKAARDADQRRAVELLRAALAIVETGDPPAYPREARP